MSMIAARQIQQQLVDVNNFWKFPSKLNKNFSATPFTIIKNIPFFEWLPSIAINGYIQPSKGTFGSFTDHSVTTCFSGGYSFGVFVDLEPGTYKYSGKWEDPTKTIFGISYYGKLPDQSYQYKSSKRLYIDVVPENFDQTFTVGEDEVVALCVTPDGAQYNTLSNIVIRVFNDIV